MPVFVENPAQFSKQRLKSELTSRSVKLPAAQSEKRVYLEVYTKHAGTENTADFSSDEEEQVRDRNVSSPQHALWVAFGSFRPKTSN